MYPVYTLVKAEGYLRFSCAGSEENIHGLGDFINKSLKTLFNFLVMNVAQHLASLINSKLNLKHVFTHTGGGAMFLNDAFGNESNLKAVYCHHEQAASMAAVGYAKLNGFAACVATTGCGATNTLTGLLDAWQDSVEFYSFQDKSKVKRPLFY